MMLNVSLLIAALLKKTIIGPHSVLLHDYQE